AIRAISSSKLASLSPCTGGSTPARWAVAFLAWSQATCTWRTRGNMLGNSRSWSRAAGSICFSAQWALALASTPARLLMPFLRAGTVSWYMLRDIVIALLDGAAVRRLYRSYGQVVVNGRGRAVPYSPARNRTARERWIFFGNLLAVSQEASFRPLPRSSPGSPSGRSPNLSSTTASRLGVRNAGRVGPR